LSTSEPKPKNPSLHAQALLSERTKKYDELATEEDCVADLRALQEANTDKFISRNFYRVHGTYSDATWNRYMGTFTEFRRQAGLELSRAQHQIEKQIAKHKSVDVYREAISELQSYNNRFVKPSNGKYKTVLVCSDLHDRQLDPFCWRVFLDTAIRLKPDVVVIAGDLVDSVEFGRYEFDPRTVNVKAAFDFVRNDIFKPLREACPDSEIHFCVGNHDWRIIKLLADKTPYLRALLSDVVGLSMSKIFGLDEFKINLVCRTDLNAFTPALTRQTIKQNFLVLYDSLVIDHHEDQGFGLSGCSGHVHRTGMKSDVNLVRGPIHWVTMGAMAKVDFSYQERMNKSQQSFVVWYVDTESHQATPEHVIFSDKHVVSVGKWYERNENEK
jgi:predicted phosphodiesterase